MLQSCVIRLRRMWPDADIMVTCHAPERLASYCPGTTAIGQTLAGLPFLRMLPRRPRLAAEQVWKMAAPYVACRFRTGPVRLARPPAARVRLKRRPTPNTTTCPSSEDLTHAADQPNQPQ